jgi:hypothetical protein
MNDIIDAQNTIGIEVQYVYSLHLKIKSSYDFTKL